jgi:hypothetical protein
MRIEKPAKPAREFIAPSDLTFGFSTCKRDASGSNTGFHLNSKRISRSSKTLSTAQEEHLPTRPNAKSLDPRLAPGVVKQWGQWVKSKNIVINGIESSMEVARNL